MAWVESHQSLRSHWKTDRLARRLRVPRQLAVGYLMFLWWWALDFAEDGDLSKFEPADIAGAAEYDGDPDEFVQALVYAGFVEQDDAGRRLHDWLDYAGKLLERREADRERKRQARKGQPKRQAQDAAPEPGPGPKDARETSDGLSEDVQHTSVGHPADVHGTSGGHPAESARNPALTLTLTETDQEKQEPPPPPLQGGTQAPSPTKRTGPSPEQQVMEHYNRAFAGLWKRPLQLTRDRRDKIRARLRSFTVEQLCQAIDHIRASPFHCGDNDRGAIYATPEFVFRSDGQVDKWLAVRPRAPTPNGRGGDDPMQAYLRKSGLDPAEVERAKREVLLRS